MQRLNAILCLALICQAACQGFDIGLAQAKLPPIVQPPIVAPHVSQAAHVQQNQLLHKAPPTVFQLGAVSSKKLSELTTEEQTLEAEGRVIQKAELKEKEKLKVLQDEEKEVKDILKYDKDDKYLIDTAKKLEAQEQETASMIKEQEATKKEIEAKEKQIFKQEVKEQKRVEKLKVKEDQLVKEERVIEKAVVADAKRLSVLEREEKEAEKLSQSPALKQIESNLKGEAASLKSVLGEQKETVRELKKEIAELEKEEQDGSATPAAKAAAAKKPQVKAQMSSQHGWTAAVVGFLVGSVITLAVFRFQRGDLSDGTEPLLAA